MNGSWPAGAATEMAAEEEERGSFQVIILGGGGGPSEDNVTGILVRAVHARWARNSILAVDAGVHLSAIINSIADHMPDATRYHAPPHANPSSQTSFAPVQLAVTSAAASRRNSVKTFSPMVRSGEWGPSSPTLQIDPHAKLVLTTGPFKNILLPYETPKANAVQLLRSLIATYLITHPHLDHFSGFAINTASFHNTSRPKKVAALPQTIDAIKSHVFNDVVWPNMSDEEGGIGFVSYMRLIEGGNVALGDGGGRGYIEVCEGLEVKARSVSHGHAMRPAGHVRGSADHDHLMSHHAHGIESRRVSHSHDYGSPPDRRRASYATSVEYGSSARHTLVPCAVDSTAFFIRADATGDEILVFGDVEPDSVSILPRNAKVWADAAPKVASGALKAIFIECSYPDSQTDETLFGHLAPRHLMAELAVLAEHTEAVRRGRPPTAGALAAAAVAKRKRQAESVDLGRAATRRRGRAAARRGSSGSGTRETASLSPRPRPHDTDSTGGASGGSPGDADVHFALPRLRGSIGGALTTKPLQGLKVVVIHIKDQLSDAASASDTILRELRAHPYHEQLGAEFIVPVSGGYMYL